MDEEDRIWRDQIAVRYPEWGTERWKARWRETPAPVRVGQAVIGEVIARAPFGVWLEAGLGTPALLLVPYMMPVERRSPIEYPELGVRLECWVRAVGPEGEVGVTQRPLDEEAI